MRWIVLLSLAVAVNANYGEMRCEHPACIFHSEYNGRGNFTVEGHNIRFGYSGDRYRSQFYGFTIDCFGQPVLESPAMPHFVGEYRTHIVYLINCPLPADGTSIATLLVKYKVVLVSKDDEVKLYFMNPPLQPKLRSSHFRGLDSVTTITIDSSSSGEQLEPEVGFLSALPKLTLFDFKTLRLPLSELSSLPNVETWRTLRYEDTNMGPLHEVVSSVVQALPNMYDLNLEKVDNPEAKRIFAMTNIYNHSPVMSSLAATEWSERKLAPLEQCSNFQFIRFHYFDVEELPERWLTACHRLEQLTIFYAEKIKNLPINLLEGVTTLKKLTIKRSKVTHLPQELLKDAHNLEELDFSDGKLRTIDSSAFQTPKNTLKAIYLYGNALENSALASLADLPALDALFIASNKLHGNVCTDEDFSCLRNLPKIKNIYVEQNTVTACDNWNEHFESTMLETLNI